MCVHVGRRGGAKKQASGNRVLQDTHVAKAASTSSLRVGKFDAVLQTRNEGLLLS